MPRASTQQFLEFDQIKQGVIILKNKYLRGVMMVSSLNFALRSEDEQKAIIYQFQSFLNSLDFSIEIVVQSRKLNITGYLDKLKVLEQQQENELLKIQTGEYQKFIEELIGEGSILAKSFFVVVPFALLEIPGAKKFKGFFNKRSVKDLTDEEFQRAKSQLWHRMEYVSLGLRRCSIQSVPLHTPELIELFWSSYHPEESEVGYYPEIPSELTQ